LQIAVKGVLPPSLETYTLRLNVTIAISLWVRRVSRVRLEQPVDDAPTNCAGCQGMSAPAFGSTGPKRGQSCRTHAEHPIGLEHHVSSISPDGSRIVSLALLALFSLGERLKISEGVTGSLFAAVGTALPETMVPLLALAGGTASKSVNEEAGVGAILGAPLMLATLTTFLMTLTVLRARGLGGFVAPERTGFVRDLNYFLGAFGLAAVAMFVPHDEWHVRALLSFALVGIYVLYVVMTFRASEKPCRKMLCGTTRARPVQLKRDFPTSTQRRRKCPRPRQSHKARIRRSRASCT
jgi:hypothetical protein